MTRAEALAFIRDNARFPYGMTEQSSDALAVLADALGEIDDIRDSFIEVVVDLDRTVKQRDLLFEAVKKDTATIERLRATLDATGRYLDSVAGDDLRALLYKEHIDDALRGNTDGTARPQKAIGGQDE